MPSLRALDTIIRLAMLAAMIAAGTAGLAKEAMRTFPVPAGAGAHDIYPARTVPCGLPRNPPAGLSGSIRGPAVGSDRARIWRNAGVTVGPDDTGWITEGGQNAIARIDPPASAIRLSRCRKSAATPTSTARPFIAKMSCGSLGRMASPAGSTLKQERWRCSTHRAAQVPMASFGVTAASDCGSPARTAATSSATPARPRVRRTGICRAMDRSTMLSMSTRQMRCGSATGARTQSCASIPRRKISHPFCYRIAMPACGSSRAARAKCEVPSPPTNCSSWKEE